jgi:low temperature requirement protein LtrA
MVTDDDEERVDDSARPRRPAFLELFFDLVYVLALIVLAQKLLHRLTWSNAGQTLLLLLAFTLIWTLTVWAADAFDLNRPVVQAQIIGVMFGSLVMAAAVPQAFERHGLLFVVAYLSIHFGSSLYYIALTRQTNLTRRSWRILFWLALSAPFLFAGAFVGGTPRGVLWTVALAIEYAGAALGWPTRIVVRLPYQEWPLVGERVSERYREFVIIALGVAIFLIASTFSGGNFTMGRGEAFVVMFLITVITWRIYIHRAGEKLTSAIASATHRSRYTEFAALAHLVMVMGVLLMGVADQLVIRRPFGATPAAWGTVLLGGPAVFLVGRGLLDYTVFSRISRSRPVGLVLLAGLAPVIHLMAPVAVAAAVLVIMLAVGVSNLITVRTSPPSPAPPVIG